MTRIGHQFFVNATRGTPDQTFEAGLALDLP